MRERTLRTIFASIVLAGLAIAAVIQVGANRAPAVAEITAGSTTPSLDAGEQGSSSSTTAPEPFVYKVGVLSGLGTDNFWAFYGSMPSVWNSYILGPTKPALFTASNSQGALRPELAAAEVAPSHEGDVWHVLVELNPNLSWSDGEPITANDVVFTFDTVRRLGLGGSWSESFPKAVESMHAESDYELRIDFTRRPRLSEWPHGVGLAPIMARHVWDQDVSGIEAAALYDLPGTKDVGGGPLALSSVTEDLIVSTRNPGYTLASPPDMVEYHVYADEAAAVEALSRGQIDSILSSKGLAADTLAAIDSDPEIEVVTNPGNGFRYLGFNLDRDPMSEQAFRSALALLLDREALAGEIAHTGGAAWSLVPPANSQWYDPDAVAQNTAAYQKPLRKRLAFALDGLTAAGYSWETPPRVDKSGDLVAGSGLTIDGRAPQPLTILTPGDAYDPARPEYAQAIAEVLDALGFDARPVETDFDTVVDLAFDPGDDGELHYDMYLLGWTLGDPALPAFYQALFAAKGEMNNTGYDSRVFAKALKSYERAFTREEAFNALWDMEDVLAADLPYLPLYTNEITEAYRSDKVGFDVVESLGGFQARLGGIWDVRPTD